MRYAARPRLNSSCAHTAGPGLWIVPMLSWYDLSLDLSALEPSTAPRAADMASFTFTDFALCRWPASMEKPADTLTGK